MIALLKDLDLFVKLGSFHLRLLKISLKHVPLICNFINLMFKSLLLNQQASIFTQKQSIFSSKVCQHFLLFINFGIYLVNLFVFQFYKFISESYLFLEKVIKFILLSLYSYTFYIYVFVKLFQDTKSGLFLYAFIIAVYLL